jgi:putative membrane protein
MDKIVSKTVRISRLGTLVVATFVLTAGAARRAMAAPDAPAAGQLDDAQIVGRVLAFDRAEVQTAAAVKGKLVSTSAWQLAQRLTVDDSARDQQLNALATPNLGPEEAQTVASDSVGVAKGQTDGVEMANLSGAALDKAYVDREIMEHQSMLAALDGQLIPSAKAKGLRRQLIDLRAETAAQLEEAQNARHAQNVRETLAHAPDPVWTP